MRSEGVVITEWNVDCLAAEYAAQGKSLEQLFVDAQRQADSPPLVEESAGLCDG